MVHLKRNIFHYSLPKHVETSKGGVHYISHLIAVNPFFLLEQEVFGLFNICVVLTRKEHVEYSQNITDRSLKRLSR